MRFILIFFILSIIFYFVNCNLINTITPILSNNYSNYYFKPSYINDDNMNTLFSTDIIQPYQNYSILFNMSSVFYLSELVIFWTYNSFLTQIFLSINCLDYTMIYNDTIQYYTDQYYTIDYANLETSIIDIDFAKCIHILLLNTNNIYDHVIIKDIEVQGYDVYKQLYYFTPTNIPINSNPNFDFSTDIDVPITFSPYNNCNTTITSFNKNGTYYACYDQFNQNLILNVWDIFSITPNIIHTSSFTKLLINQSFTNIQPQIALNTDCNDLYNMNSMTNIYQQTIDFYEQTGESGEFHICLHINDIWGDTNLKIKLVEPIVYKVQGCNDVENYTKNCNTIGGNIIDIYGENFLNYYNNPIVHYDQFIQTNNTIINSTYIQSVLPEGYGFNISIRVEFEIFSEEKHLLSYQKPYISHISGCDDNDIYTTNCPNDVSSIVNIYGNNFGKDSSTILIGSNMCTNITHNSHSNISCVITGNRGIDNVVYVIQNRGKISDGQKLLSYSQCPIGYELIEYDCVACKPGYYKNTISDTNCILCADGYYSNNYNSSECISCFDNSFSNSDRTHCLCKENYYYDSNMCLECDNLDYYNNEKYICDSSGLSLQTLKNSDGYWRKDQNSIQFYKCKQEEYCPSNIINDTVICYQYHTGILCDFCIEGYAKNNDNICTICKSNSGKSTYGILSAIILSYIFIICFCLIYGNNSINKTLDINYNNEEDEEEGGEEDEDLCLMELQQKLKIVLTYVQISTILSLNLNIKWPYFMKKLIENFNKINLNIFEFVGLDYRCSTSFDYYHIYKLQMAMIPIMFGMTMVSYVCVKYWGRYKKKSDEFMNTVHNRLIYILVLIVFIIYPSVSNTILRLFKCEEIDDVWYLSSDLSVVCFDEVWSEYVVSAGFFIILYILGIPIFFYKLLKNYKNKELLEDKEIEYKYGFMYMGYNDDMWWFEILELTRKTMLSACIIYLEESPTRIIISTFLCLMYLLYITYKQPLKDNNDSFLSILSGTELVLISYCGLILEMKIHIQDKYDSIAFNIFLFMVYTTIIILGNYQLIMGLVKRNFFHKLYNKIKKNFLKIKEKFQNFKKKFEKKKKIKSLKIIRETEV